MLPVMLNLETLKILLIGQGEKLLARKAKLEEAGVKNLVIKNQQSEIQNFAEFDVVMVVGFSEAESAAIYHAAKAARCLVNVEDNKKYCDFFFQSFVRRGKLLIGVSTHGASPATAKIVRDRLLQIFPPQWEQYIDQIAKNRKQWRLEGKTYDQVNELTKEYMATIFG